MTQAKNDIDRSNRSRILGYLSRPSNLLFIAAVVVLGAIWLYVFFTTMFLSPIGFDEAFNLQAPLNLVQGNGFSTEDWLNGGPRIVFDPVVSTGPVVELPAALSFLIFGTTIEAARIVMLPFVVLLVACLFILGRRIGGRWAGLAAVGMALALNSRVDFPFTVIYGPSDALGEYAAAALIALALVLLPRYRLASGFVLGFATLAKFISFIAVPAFMIALLLVPALRAQVRTRPVRDVVFFGLASIAPSVLWELVKLVSLGPGRYLEVLLNYMRFVFRSGSGADGAPRALFPERLVRLFAPWHLPTVSIVLVGLVLFIFAVYGILRYWQPRGMVAEWRRSMSAEGRWITRLRTFTGHVPVMVWAAIGSLAAFSLWWGFISTSTFIRHTMPILLATAPLLASFAVRALPSLIERGSWRRIAAIGFAVGMVAVMGFQIASTAAMARNYEKWTRADQEDAAAFIASLGVDQVQGINWWAAPALRFLDGVPSTPVGTGTGPLVLEPITRELERGTYDFGRELCTEVLYSKNGYIVCEIPADTKPIDDGK